MNKTILTFELEFNKLPVIEKELSKLQSNVDSLEAIRKELNSLLEQISLTAAADNNSVKLVSPAVVPTNPISPNKLLILAISILLGGALSILLCLLLHMRDDTIHSLDELKDLTNSNTPFLGWIPLVIKKNKTKVTEKNENKDILILNNPDSNLSNRFKILVSNIIYGQNSTNKTFMITSPGISDGKSFLTSNIGITLAKNGYRILIIDGDIKAPSLEQNFNLKPSKHGYIRAIQENIDLNKMIINPLPHLDNLQIISPGRSDLVAAVFYKKTKYNIEFNKFAENYDYILIDAPPLEFASDLLCYINYIDSILVCTRLGICTKSSFVLLKEQLTDFQDKMGGVIATGCTLEHVKGSINKYNYYYHHYSHYNSKETSNNDKLEFVKKEKKAKKIYKKTFKTRKNQFNS